MKKMYVLGISMIFLTIFSVVVNAAPVGNIAAPAIMKSLLLTGDDEVKLGIIAAGEGDIVFDRKIKDEYGDVELSFYGSKIGVSLFDKAIIYGLVGAGSAQEEIDISGTKVEFETETDFAWGVGASVIAYETKIDGFGNGILRVGGDIKYRSAEPSVDKVTIGSVVYDLPNALITDSSVEYNEFQTALGLSYQLDKFIPYMGVKFCGLDGDVKATLSGTEYKDSFEEEESVGMFVGTDILIGDSISLNVEGRFIDEEAISFGASIRF